MAKRSRREVEQTKADLEWWKRIFEPIGCVVMDWTYRTSALVRLPSGKLVVIDAGILELVRRALGIQRGAIQQRGVTTEGPHNDV